MSTVPYHVVRITVPDGDASLFSTKLYDLGCLGLIPESSAWSLYFEADRDLEALCDFLRAQLPGLDIIGASTIGLTAEREDDTPYEPFPLAEPFWVTPPHASQALPQHAKPLIIRPGMAFGTGRHETTKLCAQAILSRNESVQSLLDVGTGSGILAILAKKCGVKTVDAVEIDAPARANARKNFALNAAEPIAMFENMTQVQGTYDAVVANVLTPTILYLKEDLCTRLKAGGHLILSGITRAEETQICEAFAGLERISRFEDGEWLGMVFKSERV